MFLRWFIVLLGYDILVRLFLVIFNYMLFEFNFLLFKNRLDMFVVEVWRSGVWFIVRNVNLLFYFSFVFLKSIFYFYEKEK